MFYFLSPPEEGLFHLDIYSGGLYLLRSLDYESHTSYSLLITASNSPIEGADSLNTSAQLELTVLDIREDLRFETDAKFTTLSEDFQTGDEVESLLNIINTLLDSIQLTLPHIDNSSRVWHQ